MNQNTMVLYFLRSKIETEIDSICAAYENPILDSEQTDILVNKACSKIQEALDDMVKVGEHD